MPLTHINHADAAGAAQATVNVTAVTIGDLMVCSVRITAGFTVVSASGGGVTNWYRVVSFSAAVRQVEIWVGLITSTGAKTITLTYSGTPGANCELSGDEWSCGEGANSIWFTQPSGAQDFTGSSTTVTYPTLVVPNTDDYYAYHGMGYLANNQNGGAPAGYTIIPTATANEILYNENVGPGSTQSPTTLQTPAGTSTCLGVILLGRKNVPENPPNLIYGDGAC